MMPLLNYPGTRSAEKGTGAKIRKTTVFKILFLLYSVPGISAFAQKAESLVYTLSPRFGEGRTKVEFTWETRGRTTSVISVAQRFGKIENVVGLLSDVRIEGAKNVKRDGALWIVTHATNATLEVSYEVGSKIKTFDEWDAQQLPIASSDFFHGIGSAFLMTPNSHPGTPAEFEVALRWVLPAGYKAACSWGGTARSVAARLKPADLKQSAYLAGKIQTRTREVDGLKVSVALVDAFPFSAEEFAEFSARIVKAECDFMGETEFPEFLVTLIPAGRALKDGETRIAGSGLYHGFSLFLAPQSPLNDGVEHLFAHELFHFWNGRLLSAADPERMVYWFVEGFTDYYALRILYESKIWSAATYAKWLNKHIREYAANPARNASNGEINEGYWTQRDTVGQVAYQRGLLLGLRWQHLSKARGGGASKPGSKGTGLDAWMRSLIDRARAGRYEISNAELRKTGTQALGEWFVAEFDKYVEQAATVEVPVNCLAPGLAGTTTTVFEHDLGFERARSLKEKRVRGLRAGGPADRAGLREGDELISWTIPGNADAPTSLEIKRDGRTRTIEYVARGEARSVLQFAPAGEAGGKRR